MNIEDLKFTIGGANRGVPQNEVRCYGGGGAGGAGGAGVTGGYGGSGFPYNTGGGGQYPQFGVLDTQLSDNVISQIKSALGYLDNPLSKCRHCGQWGAAYCECKHCGAPIDP